MALYLLSGFGGILFSACCSDMRSVGASTAVYGLVGSYLSFMILNWGHLSSNPEKKCQIILFIVLALFLSFMLGAQNIDVLGHLGGFLTGSLISLFLLPGLGTSPSDLSHQRKCKNFGKIASISLGLIFLVVFYTLREPGANGQIAGSLADLADGALVPEDSTTPATAEGESTEASGESLDDQP